MSLSRDTSHTFPAEPPADEWMECQDCGMPLPPGSEPRSLCKGMKQWHKLSRTGSLDRSTPLSPVSDSNSGRPNRDEGLLEYARQQPCVACGSPPPSDPHHVRSRGAGFSDRLEDGTSNVVSLCRSCHDALDSVGGGKETFQAEHGISLEEEAKRIGREYGDRAQLREGEDG